MSVLLYEPGLFEVLQSPVGPTTRYVTARAEAVAEIARENVRANFRTRTGNLEQSIGVFPDDTADGVECEVGTDGAPYGLVLETGSTEHDIIAGAAARVLVSKPDNPDPLLSIHFRVSHPGFPPRPWLEPALRTVFLGG